MGAMTFLNLALTPPLIDSAEVDLILVPSIACDVRNIAWRGGYDRLLSSRNVGVKAYDRHFIEFVYCPSCSIETWDKPLFVPR